MNFYFDQSVSRNSFGLVSPSHVFFPSPTVIALPCFRIAPVSQDVCLDRTFPNTTYRRGAMMAVRTLKAFPSVMTALSMSRCGFPGMSQVVDCLYIICSAGDLFSWLT